MADSLVVRGARAAGRQVLYNGGAREVLIGALAQAVRSVGTARPDEAVRRASRLRGGEALSGVRGIAVGAGAAALAPLAASRLRRLIRSGGIGALRRSIAKHSGRRDGKRRQVPLQQSVDVAVPLKTAYNQWTQFEVWPEFVPHLTRASQEDDATVRFTTRIWGRSREWRAKILTQRPDERIKWEVSDGISHTGMVTFHELGPRLTRVELALNVSPGGTLVAAREMPRMKRAARAELYRFKAFIEMREEESGGWRGVIEDGKVRRRTAPSGRKSRASSRNGSAGSPASSSQAAKGGHRSANGASAKRSSRSAAAHPGRRGASSSPRSQ